MKTNISRHKNTDFSTKTEVRSGTKTLIVSNPLVMGILNITPDSFYAKSQVPSLDKSIELAKNMINKGAQIIDIGAISTRPGAKEVNEEEELSRLLPILRRIRMVFSDIWISIDTYRSSVAKMAINEGADIINDISGGTFDIEMPKFIGKNDIPYIMMHIKGNPENMQDNPQYMDVIEDISKFFKMQIETFTNAGASQLILDPGFGFGKSLAHNYEILRHLSKFKSHGFPLMVGASRKSMISKVLETDPNKALNGTTVVNTIALMKGANILRVHDVQEAVEAIKIFNMLSKD